MSQKKQGWLRHALGWQPEHSAGFYFTDFWFRKILRQNRGVPYAVHHTATIHSPQKLTRGRMTFPGDSPGVYINATNGVHIGDFTNLGPNVGIVSVNHDFVDNRQPVPAAPIHIGNFCWLGMGAVVLPGVRLGDFTIVGANAVVTKSFEQGYCVIAGNPAVVIKSLNQSECNNYARSRYEEDAAQQ